MIGTGDHSRTRRITSRPSLVGQAEVDDQQVGLVRARLDLAARRRLRLDRRDSPRPRAARAARRGFRARPRRRGSGASPASRARLRDRQRELEARAAARAGAAPRSSPPCARDDRAADREAEPRADDRAFVASPRWNLSNSARGIARRQARAVVVDHHAHESAVGRPRRSGCVCPRGVYFAALSNRLANTCTTSAGVDVHGRQVLGQVDLDRMTPRAAFDAVQRRADQLVDRCQSRRSATCARLEAREIEHVRDELGHLPRLRLDRLRERLRASPRRGSRRAPRACCAAPAMTASGVRRSCEIDASSVLRRLSVSAATRAVSACARRAARAPARAPICPAKVSSRCSCSGSSTRRRLSGSTAEHAERSRGRRAAADRAPARPATCRSRGRRAGRDRAPTARPRDRAPRIRALERAARAGMQAPARVGQQHDRLRTRTPRPRA